VSAGRPLGVGLRWFYVRVHRRQRCPPSTHTRPSAVWLDDENAHGVQKHGDVMVPEKSIHARWGFRRQLWRAA